MRRKDFHLSDGQLLAEIDGESSAQDEKLVRSHLDECPECRARRQNLAHAMADFARVHQTAFDATLPRAEGPRSLLRARLRQASEAENERRPAWPGFGYRIASAVAIAGLLALALAVVTTGIRRHDSERRTMAVFSLPDASLTPGATIPIDQQVVCSAVNAGNKAVPVSVQRRVFEEYRIDGADPRAYEVDYLITPALGGADDIRNLWPHSYSATVWNARIKDALEDHLRDLVCGGSLDLAEAQREIATNWIAAYKKYFGADEPLPEHRRQPE